LADTVGVLTARPAAFAVFALYAVAWIAIGDGFEWHSLATLATWAMTLVIQRAEHRDTQAITQSSMSSTKAAHHANNDASTTRTPKRSSKREARAEKLLAGLVGPKAYAIASRHLPRRGIFATTN